VTVLYGFAGPPDGARPEARLLNVNGTLYGTTSVGGSSCQSFGGCGTVFSITPGGKEKVLYRFRGSPYDGAIPSAGLVDVKGTLYGTTILGGASNIGTVFSITPGGKEKVLYSFTSYSVTSVYPSGLVDVSGTLYGTTTGGGEYSAGTVFSITLGGKEKVLHSFSCCRGDGFSPQDALLNVNGTLYGTTDAGGANGGNGTVFSITLSGHETVLYSFMGRSSGKQDGSDAQSGLSYVNGRFYGTTYLGGAYDYGTVYSIKL
jgi:uncharacterized repeat protein (TIGR03803 family)